MSIKISDIIWTIICFGLFTLVVNLLLLKPMLRFMDARKERLEKARARKAELDALMEKRSEELSIRSAEEKRLLLESGKERLRAASEKAKQELKDYEAELLLRESGAKAELEKLSLETDGKLGAAIESMADAYTNKLITGGRG